MSEVVGCLRNVDMKQQKPGGSECRDTLAGLWLAGPTFIRTVRRCEVAPALRRGGYGDSFADPAGTVLPISASAYDHWPLTRARALSAATHQFCSECDEGTKYERGCLQSA